MSSYRWLTSELIKHVQIELRRKSAYFERSEREGRMSPAYVDRELSLWKAVISKLEEAARQELER